MKKKIVSLLVLTTMLIFLIMGCTTYDSDDGKCDICGKEAEYELNGEEYCYEHLGDAASWYLNQD